MGALEKRRRGKERKNEKISRRRATPNPNPKPIRPIKKQWLALAMFITYTLYANHFLQMCSSSKPNPNSIRSDQTMVIASTLFILFTECSPTILSNMCEIYWFTDPVHCSVHRTVVRNIHGSSMAVRGVAVWQECGYCCGDQLPRSSHNISTHSRSH